MTTTRYVAPGIQRRHRKLYAIQEVPKDLRQKIGRVRFVQSLDTDSLSVAKRRAAVLIADWKAQIEAARSDKPADDAAFFRQALQRAKTPEARGRLMRNIEIVASNMLGATSFPDDATIAEVKEQMAVEQEAADKWAKLATGEAVMIAEQIEPWIATTSLTPKTIDSAQRELAEFAKLYPTADDITKEAMQDFVYGLSKRMGDNTIRKRLANLRSLWRYMQREKLVSADVEPFEKLDIPKGPKNGKRRPFSREQINRLLEAATGPMNSLIMLAAYTGCRLEELASLKTADVSEDSIRIVSGKTDAAEREIPVHSAIKPLVARLIAESKEGYLLEGPTLRVNKLGVRGHNIGMQFGIMKSKLGYGSDLVFHSIRKTVATQFEEAQIPETVAARILGHELKTMSYGLYSGGVSLDVKRDAMEKAIRY
jgi:integrase